MSEKPTIVLVHGAFAESASWNSVIEELSARGYDSVAIANPLRSLTIDATYLRDVIAGIGRPVVLVGHSYGGLVITQAASGNPAVTALVYVGAFAPDTDESASTLSTQFPGSTLGAALAAYPLADGGNEFVIRSDIFHHQFAADVPEEVTALMAATQRPVTAAALGEALSTLTPAWQTVPSWFVYGDADQNIPAAAHRFAAQRAQSRGTRELAGASHAVSVSRPREVTQTILDAVAGTSAD